MIEWLQLSLRRRGCACRRVKRVPMSRRRSSRISACIGLLPALLLMGCKLDLMDPAGAIGRAEKNLILVSTALMLLVVVPVIFMTFLFAWKYRASNRNAIYRPNWHHSTVLEIIVWSVPCAIIIVLAAITWRTTHELDPYKPLDVAGKPLKIEVVALDWKWMFIYPEQGIATVNQMAMPLNTPVEFSITSDSVMNDFFIPQLGSQIYAMTGMETKLHLIADRAGIYDGLAANFNGDGFSDMRFKVIATDQKGFDDWVQKARQSASTLDLKTYSELAKPSEKNPVAYYSKVEHGLFSHIIHGYQSHMSMSHEGM
ncbi:ubiquinol oxidase subunit II [Granulibacter bethesdensis]|uniref:Ubiquinol oxidase subunit 2 n=1 Tax=Granulibacter bethesdensis (strain ATCC BAA-1260 / CGDNIH1) TaxID=391165 RepID=Q0BSM8_GRABC|nr:Cytochrome c oxidase polypeptide II [Granulibacter bethesdensis CGDNIH1]AHJ68920.1 Cytochrome c oxidase polypeptide II [Granulibacter bethesdensis]APH52001.1 Cytochrome c oxidase polypeptide II [Granulibacter bethesdensis]APH64691.1 Cytochrome c oxidase polypeptide II [Granulibacter bethesdensis]